MQKVEHFKYINFSLQQNFFQSGPRNCFVLQDSHFNNTYAPKYSQKSILKFWVVVHYYGDHTDIW